MAKVTGPLFSLDASGSLASAIVYSHWRGINYTRRLVIPANPNTADQQEVRGVFKTLTEMWKRMPQIARNPFQKYVVGKPLTDRNAHIQASALALKGDANLNDLVMSLASGGAVPPINVVETDAGGQVINVVASAPPAPPGYTLTAIQAAALKDGDPSPVLIRDTVAGEDTSAPYSINLSMGAAGTYQVGTWCKWTRDADSEIFYSTAVRDQVVVA